MLELILIVLLIIIICVVGVIYIRTQTSSVKQYVKNEIKQLVKLINDAQYKEFSFDKQNEQNIQRLEKRLLDVSAKVDGFTSID
jgi:predicted PurR-regulated permease PerM